MPFRLRLDVRLQRCERPRLVEAAIDGDLRGRAALRLEPAGGGTRAEVAWSLRVHGAPLRVAAHVAYPLMIWGHDRVVDMAVAGFGGGRYRTPRREHRNHAPGSRGAPLTGTRDRQTVPIILPAPSALLAPAALGLFPRDGGPATRRVNHRSFGKDRLTIPERAVLLRSWPAGSRATSSAVTQDIPQWTP